MIYLDNAATTQPLEASVKLYADILQNHWGNPSSLHRLGVAAADAVEQARHNLAQTLAVNSQDIIWTSGATEANQTVLLGAVGKANPRKNHILLSGFEHPSVVSVTARLEQRGFDVEQLDIIEQGHISTDQLQQALRPSTALVSIIGVHNELGVKQDIVGLQRVIKNNNPKTLFHVDAVQWIGKYALPPTVDRPDFLTFSAHKCHGPKGVGGIIKKADVHLQPLLEGGNQEHNLRAGTEHVAGIVSTTHSIAVMQQQLNVTTAQAIEQALHRFVQSHPQLTWISPQPGPNKSPWISMFSARGHKSEILIHKLEDKNIFISSGSACSEKKKERKAYAAGLKLTTEEQDGLLRVSLSIFNNENDINLLIAALKDIL